ncbi:hypothetical protein ACIQFU_31600 [Streptomyces sp. NPDC093065]|uniref:hypothetical protein n=1 Tax=Streptomyces sp. NPDC093065 TaxID=3366021 RepID=UPI0038225C0B
MPLSTASAPNPEPGCPTTRETAPQPERRRRTATSAGDHRAVLPHAGERGADRGTSGPAVDYRRGPVGPPTDAPRTGGEGPAVHGARTRAPGPGPSRGPARSLTAGRWDA